MIISPKRARTTAGFTLVEIVVTVLIMGLMLTGITRLLTAVRTSRDLVHNIQEQQLAGPAILDLLERDLRGVFTTSMPLKSHLRVMDNVRAGLDADRIDFLATTDSLIWFGGDERQVRSDICEVGYCLRTNPDDSDFLEMYRREGFGVDEDVFEGGSYVLVHDHITGFNVEVYSEDGPDADPLEEWGMNSTDIESIGLPASLRISLEIELQPRLLRETQGHMRQKQKFLYTRVIRLPESLRLAQKDIPRYAIPSAQSEAAAGEEGSEEGDMEVGGAGGGGGRGGRGGGTRTGPDGRVIDGSTTDRGGGGGGDGGN
jgi:type II secretory pathway component PulJ